MNALWLSYLDAPLQLQQGSSLFIFFSKQQGKSGPELGIGVHPIPVVPLMSEGVGPFSEKVPRLDDWRVRTHCGKQLQSGDLYSSNKSQVF